MLKVAYMDHTARWSGGEVALFNILVNLDSQIDPLVILGEEGPFAERLREKGIDVRVVPMDERTKMRERNTINLGLFSDTYKLFKYGRSLAALLKEEQVACVHTNSLKSAFFGAVAAKTARLPLIWHMRDHIGPPYMKPIVARTIRFLTRLLPTGVIATSKSTLHSLQLPESKKTLVVYSSFAKSIGEPPAVLPHNKGEFNVILAGRLAHWKGQHVLLEAAKGFRDTPGVNFWLAGDALFGEDTYKAELIRQMEADGLTNVKLLGHVEDIQGIMRKADLLLHTSITPEPFGQVIIEGMAEGLPVIASNEGGPLEIVIHGETGFLIPPDKPQELEEAIRWMLDHPEERRRMGERGRKRVKDHFVIEDTVASIMDYYKGLLTAT